MFERNLVSKAILAVVLFFLAQLSIFWFNIERMDDKKLTLEAEIHLLERKRDLLRAKIFDSEKVVYRLEVQLKNLKRSVRDVLPMAADRKNMPTIYFITPTYYRPTQKADLIRLSQTLAHIPNLHWIVVEDSNNRSESVFEVMEKSGLLYTHLNVATPKDLKLGERDPDWKFPKGVLQRNAALTWLRINLADANRGVVYFGDDDNTYDIRLFPEIRSVRKIGVWPVGIVGGMLVETPVVENGGVVAFNSIWKPHRTFPFDMAGFAVNITLILGSKAIFTFDVPRGHQETSFLESLFLNRSILEPKADQCRKVLVWHTRTEKTKLVPSEQVKFQKRQLNDLEMQAVG